MQVQHGDMYIRDQNHLIVGLVGETVASIIAFTGATAVGLRHNFGGWPTLVPITAVVGIGSMAGMS